MPAFTDSMTRRTLSGLFWMALATGANVLTLMVVLVVLAHLLTPAAFGLGAAALMVIGFTAIFAELGIGPAVVQRLDLQPAHVRAAFTLSFGLGVVFYVITWLMAPLIAAALVLPELTPLLRALAIVFPAQGLGIVAESLLQRELRFRCLAGLDTVAVVVGYGGVAVTLGLLGFSVWALVGAHIAQIVLKTVLLLALHPHPVGPLYNRRVWGDLLNFSSGFTAGRFSNYLAGQGENLVLSYSLGPTALGVYGRAYQLMAGPAVLFGNVLDRVLFPAMVHVQDQPKRLADAYRRGSALIALVILPVSAVLIVLAPEVTHVALGPEWGAVTLPLQILGVGMLFRTSCKISDSLVRATGAVHRRAWRQTAYAIAVLAGAWVGQHWGVDGVAVAVLATLALNAFLMAHLSLRISEMSWKALAAAHVPGLALAIAVAVPLAVVTETLRASGLAPLTILMVSLMGLAPAVVAVLAVPAIFLGSDGQWMVRKIVTLLRTARVQDGAVPPRAVPDLANGLSRRHVIARLTEGLAGAQVRYCRWKSRVDLTRLLSGAGDLDLLVDRRNTASFLRVAQGLGFAPVVSTFGGPDPQDIHLYGPDRETGTLLHLHINLTLGSRDLDELVLATAAMDNTGGLLAGMPVVDPAAELAGFVLRTMDAYSRWRALPRVATERDRLDAKLQVLLTPEAVQRWRELLPRYLPAIPLTWFADSLNALSQPTSWWRRYRLARRMPERTIASGSDPGSILIRAGALWCRIVHGQSNPKQLPGAGAVIAIIGPDASGKSTMVAATRDWLDSAFRVQVAHLGKPPSTWLTWLPNTAGRTLGRLIPRLRTVHQPVAATQESPRRRGLLYRIRAVLLAYDRRALSWRVANRAARGWMVICDRYPSADIGAADSARLPLPTDEPGLPRLHAWLARLEQRLYRDISQPTVVVRLRTSLTLALARNRDRDKPGKEGDDFIARRHHEFCAPIFSGIPVLDLDTGGSREEAIRHLRRCLWDRLVADSRNDSAFDAREAGRPMLRLRRFGARPHEGTLVVEFIGVTGVGKSTLIAAVRQNLAAQGLHVADAEQALLGCYRIALNGHARLSSALTLLLSLPPFARFFLTRDGARLARLAWVSICRGMGNPWNGVNLLRNFVKRVGAHCLLERLRDQLRDYDVVIWDEGAVHAAHNLFVHATSEPRPEEIEEFGRLIPRPDLLVWVTAPTSQSVAVLLGRGHTRVPAKAGAAVAFAEHAQTTFDLLARAVDWQDRILRVDNSLTAGDANGAVLRARARAVAEFLLHRLRAGAQPAARLHTPPPDSVPLLRIL